MNITRKDVQERFTIAVPFAWVGNHIISSSVIPIGANIGTYGVNYRLYLYHSGNTNYHIVTGYRTSNSGCDIHYYECDIQPFTETLDYIKSLYHNGEITYEKAVFEQDKILFDLYLHSIEEVNNRC